MPTRFPCPACAVMNSVPDDLVGQKIRCSGCRFDFQVPAGEELAIAEGKVLDYKANKPCWLGRASLILGLVALGFYSFGVLVLVVARVIRPSIADLGTAIVFILAFVLLPFALGTVMALAGLIFGLASL